MQAMTRPSKPSAKPVLDQEPAKLLLGQVVGVKGLQGHVRVKSFTARAEDLDAYGALCDDKGNEYKVKVTEASPNLVIAKIKGVDDRNAAEKLKGLKLFIARDQLPKAKEHEFYHADLIGLEVRDSKGQSLGAIKGVYNYGAGDIIEVKLINGGEVLWSFTRKIFPTINIAEGYVTAEPPLETEAEGKA
ncbi:MAG: ribosome maturation factor RimM [Dongiaceae bacterium]